MKKDDSSMDPRLARTWARRAREHAIDSVDPQAVSALIGSIYQGAMDPPAWLTGLQQLKTLLGAAHVALLLRPPSPQTAGVTIHTDTLLAQAAHTCKTHFFAFDPFLRLPPGEVLTPEDLIGADWPRTALCTGYLRPQGVGPVLGVDFLTDDGVEGRLRVSRALGAPGFGAGERALCRLLLPHLRRAVQMHARVDALDCERQLLTGALERTPLGLITLAHDGRVLDVNGEARRIGEALDGLRIAERSVQVEDAPARAALQRALAADTGAAVGAVATSLRVPRSSGRAPYALVLRPVPPHALGEGHYQPALALYLRDPESARLPSGHEAVRRQFGLTRTEVELTLRLVEGATVDEAAARLGLSREAARTHLRLALAKTGLTRQAALAQLVLGSAMSLAGAVE